MTPERADSTGKGTRICVGKDSTFRASLGVMARFQRPLRFSQELRTICGRGYSGRGFLRETSAAQRVLSGASAGCHSAAESGRARKVRQKNIRQKDKTFFWNPGIRRFDGERSALVFIFLPLFFCQYHGVEATAFFFL